MGSEDEGEVRIPSFQLAFCVMPCLSVHVFGACLSANVLTLPCVDSPSHPLTLSCAREGRAYLQRSCVDKCLMKKMRRRMGNGAVTMKMKIDLVQMWARSAANPLS